jgi:hypothetical protein
VTFDPFKRLDRATLRALREEGEGWRRCTRERRPRCAFVRVACVVRGATAASGE